MHNARPNTNIRRFFAGITEHAFQTQLGVADPPLLDYITDMLVRFVRHDSIYKLRDSQGKPLTGVVDMLTEARQRVGDAKREVHQHIGDYTLFWAGLYPEALPKKQAETGRDGLIDYCQQGKRAYWIASTLATKDETKIASGKVFERLSCEFELCTYGLREVRAEWERRDDETGDRPFLIN